MRILIISDTHGYETNLKKVLSEEGKPDYLLHLGDFEGGEERIEKLAGCPCDFVAGNCDYFSQEDRVKFLDLDGLRIMMAHGNRYYVTAGLGDLEEEARRNGCDIAMFGHTHKPVICEEKNLTLLNPGSLSFPRQEGRRPSYIIMETDGSGGKRLQIRYL